MLNYRPVRKFNHKNPIEVLNNKIVALMGWTQQMCNFDLVKKRKCLRSEQIEINNNQHQYERCSLAKNKIKWWETELSDEKLKNMILNKMIDVSD